MTDRTENSNLLLIKNILFRIQKKKGISLRAAVDELLSFFQIDSITKLAKEDKSKLEDILCQYETPLEEINERLFSAKGIDFVSVWPTPVMLDKSIADATATFRLLLKENGRHDFSKQKQGPENKVVLQAFRISEKITPTKLSLYRPVTKKGDPRFWLYGMQNFCCPGDKLIVSVIKGNIYFWNFSQFNYKQIAESDPKAFAFFNSLSLLSKNAEELISLLRKLAGKKLYPPNVHDKQADTDVGMAVEKALKIKPNSKAEPDFKGIEIKAKRKNSVGRTKNSLFTKVPNKDLSPVRFPTDFVQLCGYPIRNKEKITQGCKGKELHVTVTALKPNAEGLQLKVDYQLDWLEEILTLKNQNKLTLLIWKGEDLRNSLRKKHKESVWIICDSFKDPAGHEYFQISSITYTHSPLILRFLDLIDEGKISVEHMISLKKTKKGFSLSEKGPAFKILPRYFDELFPQSKVIDLD